MKPKSFKRCSICKDKTLSLFKCNYCEKEVCKKCLASEKEFGQVCFKCYEETARALRWNGWELLGGKE